MKAGLAVLSQYSQHDRQAGMYREQWRQPRAQILLAFHRIQMKPVVIRRQVELTDSPGNPGALLDRHQPFVLAQMRTDLAALSKQLSVDVVDF